MPLLLWPGLAADERLFTPLLEQRSHLRVPPFISPMRNESLRDYAARYAAELAPTLPQDGRFAVGGFSFGGQLAQELAAALSPSPACVVLICGVRGRHQILPSFKRQQRLGAIVPKVIARRLYVPVARNFARRETLDHVASQRLIDMARDIDPAFLKWSAAACAAWPGPPALEAPIRHIHGGQDQVIPDLRRQADQTIDGAGHLITLTHPERVLAFIDASLAEFASRSSNQQRQSKS